MRLLTPAHANAKTAKNNKLGKYLSYILHLAPSDVSGFNVCPMASAGCKAACLNTAGRGAFNSVQAARIRKTKYLFTDRINFFNDLFKDLKAVDAKAKKLKLKGAVRLNGTSDLNWVAMKYLDGLSLIELFPNIQFYDYTKVLARLKKPVPKNYHLTFSRSETNESECLEALSLGFNVAVVFKGIPHPFKNYLNRQLQDGDKHDLRFLDRKRTSGEIIALTAKGKAKRDVSGFVVTYD